jgi:SAM-dependent methyltransferase
MTTPTNTAATSSEAAEVSRYTFDNSDPQGSQQVRLLADICDEHSTYVLAGTGISPGWQVLDVGPGAGTITAWLAERIRPNGHVTALDLDPRHIPTTDNVTVRHGDVRTAALPVDHYDLIHVRLLLLHLAEREAVLDRLAASLKPGGLLVVSDWDGTRRRDWLLHAPSPAHTAAFDAFQNGLLAELVDNGADLGWAHRAPLAMRAAGLVDLDTVAHHRLWAGGEAGCLLHVSNSHQLHDALLGRGVTAEQLDQLREAMHHPDTLAYGYQMFTTVGRRPEAGR